jgi:hypothetical protein
VIETGVAHQSVEGFTGARLGVRRSENQPIDTALNDRPGTHRTGLECHIQGATVEPPGPEATARKGQRDPLGVRGRIASCLT